MRNKIKFKDNLTLSVFLCLFYLLLTFFYYHIDKKTSGIIFIIIIFIIVSLFITIFFQLIREVKGLFQNRNNLNIKILPPIIIYLITLIYSILNPLKLSSEIFESRVEFRACYEGTQNQAYILFRKDKTFELNWTGVFGYNEWWTGKWHKKGNVLFLKYDNKKVEQLGNKLLIENGYLNPIGESADKAKYPRPMFYLGYCQNKN